MNARTILLLLLTLSSVLLLVGNVSLSAAEPVTLDSLLKEMVDRSALTRICDPPYLAKAATRYDRESKVNDPEDGLHVEKKTDAIGPRAGLPSGISINTSAWTRSMAVRNTYFWMTTGQCSMLQK